MVTMCWINSFSLSPARRIARSFLFFLYVIVCCLVTVPGSGQTPAAELNQDSVNYYLRIVEEGEKQVGKALANLGYLYQKSGRYNSAISYFDRALPFLNGEDRSLEVARIHTAKGIIYEIFGDNAEPARYYALARNSYLKSAQILEEMGNGSLQMSINQHLADIATKRGDYNTAVVYQNKVIKALTQLYKDSLQTQAESFNELLNKEIESSKDTIYVEVADTSKPATEQVPLTNWRHILIFLFALGLLFSILKSRNQQETIASLQEEVSNIRKVRQQLEQQQEELQCLNLKLTKTEKEQRRSSMTKDKIFSVISHDLRSPINTISGLLNILRAKMSSMGDIELRNLVGEVSESTDRLTHFLDDLLKWSMSQMGQLKPSVERVNMRKLVQENYSLMKPRLKAKNIHFKASVPENIDVYADTNMLRLILRNLISNSIKFTRNGGYIAVGLKRGSEDFSIIEVSDDGIGMSDEQLQHLFEFRGSEINGGAGNQGAGLGLLLCKEFTELNGGNIVAASKLGEGTRFSVQLPNQHWDPVED